MKRKNKKEGKKEGKIEGKREREKMIGKKGHKKKCCEREEMC